MSVTRATTPGIILRVKNNYDLSNAIDIWVTLRQGSTQLTKKWKQGESTPGITVDGQIIAIKLLQEEMLKFKEGVAEIQAKFFESDGDPNTRYDNVIPTVIKSIKVKKILNEEIMK